MTQSSTLLILLVVALILIVIDAVTSRCPPWIWGLLIVLVLIIQNGDFLKLVR